MQHCTLFQMCDTLIYVQRLFFLFIKIKRDMHMFKYIYGRKETMSAPLEGFR
jgi:hypothetical protein